MNKKMNSRLVDVRYNGVRLFLANTSGSSNRTMLEYIDSMLISDYPECDRTHVFYGRLMDNEVEQDLQALHDKNNLFSEYAD